MSTTSCAWQNLDFFLKEKKRRKKKTVSPLIDCTSRSPLLSHTHTHLSRIAEDFRIAHRQQRSVELGFRPGARRERCYKFPSLFVNFFSFSFRLGQKKKENEKLGAIGIPPAETRNSAIFFRVLYNFTLDFVTHVLASFFFAWTEDKLTQQQTLLFFYVCAAQDSTCLTVPPSGRIHHSTDDDRSCSWW